MRVLRRRTQIITLLVAFVAPVGVAVAAPAADDERNVWATVNVCDTSSAPNTIGIRASMPGSRTGAEVRWMRFVVEYLSEVDDRWHRVAAGGDSGYLRVGAGRRPRQFGRSLRRGSARTRKGHRSNAGADPPGYSASTCTITD
jgi:hypothetical protein